MTSFLIGLSVLLICYCAVAKPALKKAPSPRLSVAWNIIQNGAEDSSGKHISELVLTNNGTRTLGNRGWELYFNFCRKVIPESVVSDARIVHVNGDLFRLEPLSDFAPLRQGMSRTIQFQTNYWVIKESDCPSGCYLLIDDELTNEKHVEILGEVKVGAILSDKQTKRSANDMVVVPTPRSRYQANLSLIHNEENSKQHVAKIVPSPSISKPQDGTVYINHDTVIIASEPLVSEANYLADVLNRSFGVKLPVQAKKPESANFLSLSISDISVAGKQKTSGNHAYHLTVQENAGISIVGTDRAGVFYGIQSLRSLLPIDAYGQSNDAISFDAIEVEDAPRFRYRGMHVDVARNFQTSDSVKKLLELMAFYKLNKLHFHLTDDEGWRLEILGLPELTEIGSRRMHSKAGENSLLPSFGSGPDSEAAGSHGSGYYSRQDFIDILKYASERHIEVIPEIDLPGHSRAAIRAMEVRRSRLLSTGKDKEAVEFLLRDPQDDSHYESVQMWNDNVVDVCLESTYAFIRHVVSDIKSMYADANLELSTVHLGGDEVPEGAWKESTACRVQSEVSDGGGQLSAEKKAMSHFFVAASQFLGGENIVTAAWEEVFLNDEKTVRTSRDLSRNRFIGQNYQCYVWNNVWGWGQEDAAYRLANEGVNVVLCNATHLYFDLAYDKDPEEPGYYWAGFVDTKAPFSFAPMNYLSRTRRDLMGHEISQEAVKKHAPLTDTGKQHILGIQGHLWGENIKGENSLEYMALPRLIALAERAWAEQPEWAKESDSNPWPLKLDRAWSDFAHLLGQRELPRLDYLEGGFHYRIPVVGAVIEGGLLKANLAFPGFSIRYTTDGSEPDINSELYSEPIRVGSSARLRAFNRVGRGGRSCSASDPSAQGKREP